jgi:pyruvate dehydrogenase (quinone)
VEELALSETAADFLCERLLEWGIEHRAVAVCMAMSGPGAIHLLNGLYDAKLDHQPVVAIVGQTFVRALGGDFQQEVNLLQLYSDVASAYVQQVNEPSSIRHNVDRAMRIAEADRTVTATPVPPDAVDPLPDGPGPGRGRQGHPGGTAAAPGP